MCTYTPRGHGTLLYKTVLRLNFFYLPTFKDIKYHLLPNENPSKRVHKFKSRVDFNDRLRGICLGHHRCGTMVVETSLEGIFFFFHIAHAANVYIIIIKHCHLATRQHRRTDSVLQSELSLLVLSAPHDRRRVVSCARSVTIRFATRLRRNAFVFRHTQNSHMTHGTTISRDDVVSPPCARFSFFSFPPPHVVLLHCTANVLPRFPIFTRFHPLAHADFRLTISPFPGSRYRTRHTYMYFYFFFFQIYI